MSQRFDVRLGPFRFDVRNPQSLQGPEIDTYVVEHQVPGREGGVVEYVGSRRKIYTLRGFLSPSEILTDRAASILSGVALININVDQAKDALLGLKGSGTLLLKFESTYSSFSGYAVLYENDFFFIRNLTFGFEAGKSYPYYPYSIQLLGASPRQFGNSGIGSDWSPTNLYFSGYIIGFSQRSGQYTSGETINSVGFYISAINSGNAKVAIYNQVGGAGTLQAESASQAVHSGWNWFPLRPSFTTLNDVLYTICMKADVAGVGGFTIRGIDSSVYSNVSGNQSYQSGISYGPAFPSSFIPGTFANVSGFALSLNMVASI